MKHEGKHGDEYPKAQKEKQKYHCEPGLKQFRLGTGASFICESTSMSPSMYTLRANTSVVDGSLSIRPVQGTHLYGRGWLPDSVASLVY